MDIKSKKCLVGIIHGLHIGGAQKMMVSILNYFSDKAFGNNSFEVHLIVFSSGGILKEELSENIILHNLNCNSIIKGLFSCLKLVNSLKVDLVFSGIGHLNLALAPFIPFMKLYSPKIKWIARETNIVSLQNKASKYPKLFDWLYMYFYKNYDHIIAQSIDMKVDLAQHYKIISNISVINNPVDIEKITNFSKEEHSTFLNKNNINLLSVAGLRKEKSHNLMLQVISLLDERYHLTIIGSGELDLELKELAKSLEIEHRVSFLGFRVNPYVFMKDADFFLLTSQREGFPNVLLEANSVGLPIVAFASLGGITEIVHEGINGFTVPYGEIECMRKKIEKATTFTFNKQKIKEMTKRCYSDEIILKKYEHLFTSIKDKR